MPAFIRLTPVFVMLAEIHRLYCHVQDTCRTSKRHYYIEVLFVLRRFGPEK